MTQTLKLTVPRQSHTGKDPPALPRLGTHKPPRSNMPALARSKVVPAGRRGAREDGQRHPKLARGTPARSHQAAASPGGCVLSRYSRKPRMAETQNAAAVPRPPPSEPRSRGDDCARAPRGRKEIPALSRRGPRGRSVDHGCSSWAPVPAPGQRHCQCVECRDCEHKRPSEVQRKQLRNALNRR